MIQTQFSRTVDIPAPLPLVWSVMEDVERWPEWTPSVLRVNGLSPRPLRVGRRARVHQPKLLPAWWRVTELNPGAGFTWVSIVPGARVEARHWFEPTVGGCSVTLSIRYEALFGTWLAQWEGELNDRCLALEAVGLKERCVAPAMTPCSLKL